MLGTTPTEIALRSRLSHGVALDPRGPGEGTRHTGRSVPTLTVETL
jgi:hypothetical protein